MGMHFGLIAVKDDVDKFKKTFFELWSEYAVVDEQRQFDSSDAAWHWKNDNEEVVYAADWRPDNPGKEAVLFFQDGEWAVYLNSDFLNAVDDEKLELLSKRYEQVMSFMVETSSACARFAAYSDGSCVRLIDNVDGELNTTGDRLPEESQLSDDDYYMEETDMLMSAVGLSKFEDMPVIEKIIGVVVSDTTDYSDLLNHSSDLDSDQGGDGKKGKKWWQFW